MDAVRRLTSTRAAAALRALAIYGLDLLLPPRCPACREIVENNGRFCLSCWTGLTFITDPVCAGCGAPFDIDRGPGARCGACLETPPRFAAARAALAYAGSARTVLLGFKHGDRQHLVEIMAPQMVRAGHDWFKPDTVLVPVPLHRRRLWQRGFNQAALLARAVARRTGSSLAVDALVRVKPTRSSQGMGRRARAGNVRGVFKVARPEAIKGKEIIVIDDVFTTGATAEACARILLRRGASTVRVLTWTRGCTRRVKPAYWRLRCRSRVVAKVEVYTKFLCPFCARAMKLLKNKGVTVEEIDITMGGPARAAMLARSQGRTTVPQIFIDGQPIGGSDDLAALDRNGELDGLLAA